MDSTGPCCGVMYRGEVSVKDEMDLFSSWHDGSGGIMCVCAFIRDDHIWMTVERRKWDLSEKFLSEMKNNARFCISFFRRMPGFSFAKFFLYPSEGILFQSWKIICNIHQTVCFWIVQVVTFLMNLIDISGHFLNMGPELEDQSYHPNTFTKFLNTVSPHFDSRSVLWLVRWLFENWSSRVLLMPCDWLVGWRLSQKILNHRLIENWNEWYFIWGSMVAF